MSRDNIQKAALMDLEIRENEKILTHLEQFTDQTGPIQRAAIVDLLTNHLNISYEKIGELSDFIIKLLIDHLKAKTDLFIREIDNL